MSLIEKHVENQLNEISRKNKEALDAAQIQPLAPEWLFCTNGLYLLFATAGCGKSRFIIKHIRMSESLFKEPYYNLICYCSTSGELDKTVSTFKNSNIIKTPLVEVEEANLLTFLSKHLKRKKKYYSMIEYIRSGFKIINKTLQHSIDKHNFKIKMKRTRKHPPCVWDNTCVHSTGAVYDREIFVDYVEKVNKPKLHSWILTKFQKYNVNRAVIPLLVILDDFAGSKLIERKETPLAKMMTKCRHYSCTFIIAVQTAKYVIKNIRRQATDIVVWKGLSEEDFFELMKEIQCSYSKDQLWQEYRLLQNQKDYLILHVKANCYRFVLYTPNS